MTKKFINRIIFSFITKNCNQEILTKNLVTFKRWDGVKDKKFQYYEGSLKSPIFRGLVHKNPVYREQLT